MTKNTCEYKVWVVRPKGGEPFICDAFGVAWQFTGFSSRKEANKFRKTCGWGSYPPVKTIVKVAP